MNPVPKELRDITVLHGDNEHPAINEWSIPHGVGFYNIEFAVDGTLWISDTAGFGTGGAVYAFALNEEPGLVWGLTRW